MSYERGAVPMQASMEADYAGPIDNKQRVNSIEDLFALQFKWEGMKVYVKYNASLPETTGKTYELLPLETLTLADGMPVPASMYGKSLEHWKPIGSGGAGSGNRIEAYTPGVWKVKDIAIAGMGFYTPKADIADSQVAPTGTGGTYWNLLYLAASKQDILNELTDYLRIDDTHYPGYLKGDPTGSAKPTFVEKIPAADIDFAFKSGDQTGNSIDFNIDFQERTLTGQTVIITSMPNLEVGKRVELIIDSKNRILSGTGTMYAHAHRVEGTGTTFLSDLAPLDMIKLGGFHHVVADVPSDILLNVDRPSFYNFSAQQITKIDQFNFNVPNVEVTKGTWNFLGGVVNKIVLVCRKKVGDTYYVDASIYPYVTF